MKKHVFFIFLSFTLSQAFAQSIIPLDNEGEKNKFVFDSLKTLLNTKRIICLGESEHLIETFSQCKTELVKYLHENLGYEVLAFEGGVLKISNAYYNIKSDTAALKESLYGIWKSESVLGLFRYSKQNKNSQDPLIFTGFDVKSGLSNSASVWLGNIFKVINSKYAETVYLTDTLFINKSTPYDHYNKPKFIPKSEAIVFQTFYASLLDTLNIHKDILIKQNILDETQFKIIKQSILNRKYLAEFITFTDFESASHYRDSIMSQNIQWLVNDLYKDKKIILWAHDFHISKKTIKEYRQFNQKSSIEMLPAELKNQIATISLNFIKKAPKKIQGQIKLLKGNAFFINQPDYMNGEFEGVIYFKKTESINKYKLK